MAQIGQSASASQCLSVLKHSKKGSAFLEKNLVINFRLEKYERLR